MIFNLIKHAKQLLFDDSTAKTGSGNVQGAIEATKTKVDALADGNICYEVGDSYMGVNSSGKIVEITVDEISGRVNTVSTKKAVQSHDDVLKVVGEALDGVLTTKSATVNSAYGSGDVYEVSIGKLATVTGTITFSKEKPAGSSNVIVSGLSGSISGTAFVSSNIQDTYPAYITGTGNLVSNVAIPSGTIFRFNASYVIK